MIRLPAKLLKLSVPQFLERTSPSPAHRRSEQGNASVLLSTASASPVELARPRERSWDAGMPSPLLACAQHHIAVSPSRLFLLEHFTKLDQIIFKLKGAKREKSMLFKLITEFT